MKEHNLIKETIRENNRKEFWQGFAIVVPTLVICACCFVGLFHLDRAKYNECIDNPPDTSWVEEDLEDVFMTNGVIVYDEDNETDRIYYKVEANGLNYKVLYNIKHPNIGYYYWGYTRHIEIKEEIDDE